MLAKCYDYSKAKIDWNILIVRKSYCIRELKTKTRQQLLRSGYEVNTLIGFTFREKSE